MRKLKTAEEISHISPDISDKEVIKISVIQINQMIVRAQRDALECAAENVETEFSDTASVYVVNKSSILNLIPKDMKDFEVFTLLKNTHTIAEPHTTIVKNSKMNGIDIVLTFKVITPEELRLARNNAYKLLLP